MNNDGEFIILPQLVIRRENFVGAECNLDTFIPSLSITYKRKRSFPMAGTKIVTNDITGSLDDITALWRMLAAQLMSKSTAATSTTATSSTEH